MSETNRVGRRLRARKKHVISDAHLTEIAELITFINSKLIKFKLSIEEQLETFVMQKFVEQAKEKNMLN